MMPNEPNQEAGPPERSAASSTPRPDEAGADLKLIAQMVRDFRVMAAATHGAVPAWVEALERVSGLGHDVPGAVESAGEGVSAREESAIKVPTTLSPEPAMTALEASGNSAVEFSGPTPTFILPTSQFTLVTLPDWTQPAAEPALPENAAFLAEVCFRQAESHRQQREHQQAMDCYREAIRLNPRFVVARLERGHLFRIEGQTDSAIADFTAALAVDPDLVDAYLRRGNALAEQGRFDEALADYSAAIQRAPDNPSAYLGRGLANAKKQDYQNVLDDVNAALRLDPTLASASFLKNLAYSHLGRQDLAFADLDRVFHLDAWTSPVSDGGDKPEAGPSAPPAPASSGDATGPLRAEPASALGIPTVAPVPAPPADVNTSWTSLNQPGYSGNPPPAYPPPGYSGNPPPAYPPPGYSGNPPPAYPPPGYSGNPPPAYPPPGYSGNPPPAYPPPGYSGNPPPAYPPPGYSGNPPPAYPPPGYSGNPPPAYPPPGYSGNPPPAYPPPAYAAPAYPPPGHSGNPPPTHSSNPPAYVEQSLPASTGIPAPLASSQPVGVPAGTPATDVQPPSVVKVQPVNNAADDSEEIHLGDLEPLTAAATFISPGRMPDAPAATDTAVESGPAKPLSAKPLPDNATALSDKYFQKGESYRQKSDFKRARACYNEAIRLNPRAVSALLERGQIYRLARKPDLAITDFNAALEVDPDRAEGYARRGNALVDQGRFDEAIEDYGAAVQLAPRNAAVFLNRALAFAKKQDTAKVLEDANAALALNPDLSGAYLLRGVAYSNRNHHDLAISDLNRAVVLEPRNALAFNERGLAFARKANYPQAVINYNRALMLSPKLAIARFNRALANRLAGEYKLAIAEFSEFIERHPQVAEAYFNRGLAYRVLREYLPALADFATALTLKPDYAEATQLHRETEHEAFASGELVPPSGPASMLAAPPAPAPPPAVDRSSWTSTPPATSRTSPAAPPPAPPPPPASPFYRPRPAPAKSRPSRQEVSEQTRDLRRRALWASGAVLGLGFAVLVISLIVGSTSDAASDSDLRFSTQQLCEKFQNSPAEAAGLNGKEIEVSGVVQSVTKKDGAAPSLVLVDAKDTAGKVLCDVDPMATSTGTMFPNVQKGKYVIVKGRCDGTEGSTVKLSAARIGFVMNPVARRKKP